MHKMMSLWDNSIFLYMNTDTYLQCRKMNSKGKIQKCNLSIAEYIAVFVHKHTQKTFLSHVSWLSLKIGLAVVWWGVIELILSKQRFSQLEANSWLRLLCCFLLASDICWKPGCRFSYLPCRQPLNLKFNSPILILFGFSYLCIFSCEKKKKLRWICLLNIGTIEEFCGTSRPNV